MRFKRCFVLFISLSCLLAGEAEPFLMDQLKAFPSVRDIAITAGGNEVYFSAQSPLGEISVIMVMKKGMFGWKAPEIASFSGIHSDLEPFLHPNGLELFFVSKRPNNSHPEGKENYDIWKVTRPRQDAPWSEAENLGAPVNTPHNEFYPAITRSGDLYLTSDGPLSFGKDDILVAKKTTLGYAEPINLPGEVNTSGYEFNAYIAPDGSYLIYTGYGYEGSLGSGDLYISHADEQGVFAAPVHLKEGINSPQMEYCPFVLGNTLYFTSRRSELNYPEDGFQSRSDLIKSLWQAQNGQSRIYQIPWKK